MATDAEVALAGPGDEARVLRDEKIERPLGLVDGGFEVAPVEADLRLRTVLAAAANEIEQTGSEKKTAARLSEST